MTCAWIYEPWEAPKEVLAGTGIELGRSYPDTMLSHSIARAAALEAHRTLKA